MYLNKYSLSTPNGVAQPLVAAGSPSPLDAHAALSIVASERATTQIEKDERVAMTYAIRATPTVFINGLRIEGDFTDPEIDETIEEELDAVDLLQQEPVPQAKIYAIRVHANLLDLDLE